MKDLLDETKSFKFQITLFLAFKKELNEDETMLLTNYFKSNAELIINDLNIDESLELWWRSCLIKQLCEKFKYRFAKILVG